MKCFHCANELQSENLGQQDKLSILIQWLCELTCIPWLREWSADPPKNCQQYGVVEITSSDLRDAPDSQTIRYEHVSAVDAEGDPLERHCLVFDFTEETEITLRVYRDAGKTVVCDEVQSEQPARSAFDVLRHIRLLSFTDDVRNSLKESGIYWERRTKNTIRTVEDFENGDFCGTHAEMDISLNICQTASYPTSGELFHYCVFNCEGKPVCLPKPTC